MSVVLIPSLVIGLLIARFLVRGTRWRRTRGTVLSSEVRPAPGSSEAWLPVVVFQYRLEGRDYTISTDAMRSGAAGSSYGSGFWGIPRSRESALAAISNFQPGMACTVIYDASDPLNAVLSAVTASSAPVRIALIAGVIVILLAGLVMFLFASSNT